MNYLDYIICAPLLWGAYKGFTRGFLFEIALIIALFVGVYGAFKFSYFGNNYLQAHYQISQALLPFVSFLLVFAAIVIIVLLGAKLLEWAIKLTPLGIVNKISGALLGIVKWTFVISAIFYMLIPIDSQFHLLNESTKKQSVLYEPMNKFAGYVMPEVKNKMKTYTGK